jgi:alkylation response protein AidB-like acyl-CoA dehydrogenase
MSFVESQERQALRSAVTQLVGRYGWQYADERARLGEPLTELWQEAGRAGFLGVNIPEEYGGGGAGIYELALVLEELAKGGCPLVMMVVSPAICGTIISRFGTEEQKKEWLPGIADGSVTMAFGITEPDAGSNSHKISTTARRDGDGWTLTGRKVFVTGVDRADAVLIVARMDDARTGRLKPALFILPRETKGFEYTRIEMDIVETERQFMLFLDDVRLPKQALVGEEDAALAQLFAGLNPERIMAAAISVGSGRFSLSRAAGYATERSVWGVPIGAHQGLAHPLAKCHIEVELARLMMQKAATLYDEGDDEGAGEAANMAKYAAAEASIAALDQAIQSHGGNGLAREYGLAAHLASVRIARVAPVSREMILSFVAQHSLGLPRSY